MPALLYFTLLAQALRDGSRRTSTLRAPEGSEEPTAGHKDVLVVGGFEPARPRPWYWRAW
jgi:hypothetical protein